MGILFIGTGNTTLGHTTRDKDGNIVEQIPAKWEADPEGGSVALAAIDPETMQPVEGVSVYGNWDAASYLQHVLEILAPNREINIPDMKKLLRNVWKESHEPSGLCAFCEGKPSVCRDCILKEWQREWEDEDPDE